MVNENNPAKELAEKFIVTHEKVINQSSLLDNLNVGVYRSSFGLQGKFIEVNSAMVSIFEAESKEKLLEIGPARLYGDVTWRRKLNREIIKNGLVKDEEVQLVTLRGKKIWAAVTAIMKKDLNGKVYFDGIVEDITTRKNSYETLRQEKEKAQKYFDVAGVVMLIINKDQTVGLINKKGCEILSCNEQDISGKNWFDTFIPERMRQEVKMVFAKLMAGEMEIAKYFENYIMTGTGQERLIGWHNTILKDYAGNIVASLSSGEDITERKFAEKLKDEYISTISHELRTPLSISREGLGLVIDGAIGKINKKQLKVLTISRDNIDRLVRIVSNLLELSRIEIGKAHLVKELFNIVKVIDQVITSFEGKAKEKKIKIKSKIPKKRIEIFADIDKITQVFINLIDNAIKFTDKGFIEIAINEGEENIFVDISDTGIGMSSADLPRVFNRFERLATAGKKGTGLGLYIVKEIIDLHEGKISVTSRLSEGTKFSFVLPRPRKEDLLSEYISRRVKEVVKQNSDLSIFIVVIDGFDKIKDSLGSKRVQFILKSIKEVLVVNLRRLGDVVFNNSNQFVIFLSDCDKESSLRVKDKLELALKNYASRENLIKHIGFRFECLSYPEEIQTYDGLIYRVKTILKLPNK